MVYSVCKYEHSYTKSKTKTKLRTASTRLTRVQCIYFASVDRECS